MALSVDTLVLATHNAGKIAEFRAALTPLIPTILTATDLRLPEPEETGATFLDNARLKALAAAQACSLPVLADDSGLSVEALSGAPGIYSARWAGAEKDFAKAMQRVHTEIADSTNRTAAFIAVLVLALPDGTCVEAEGRVEGTLCWPPRGAGGFGYDPMFVPLGETRSFGEMTLAEKAAYSHRMRALENLRAQLAKTTAT